MVLFTIKMNALTENRMEFLQLLQSITTLISNEKGCLSCNAFQYLENDNSFCLIDAWETQDDLDRHIRSNKFSVLLGARTLLSRPPDVTIHEVSSSTMGMKYVLEVRDSIKKA